MSNQTHTGQQSQNPGQKPGQQQGGGQRPGQSSRIKTGRASRSPASKTGFPRRAPPEAGLFLWVPLAAVFHSGIKANKWFRLPLGVDGSYLASNAPGA